MANLKTNNIQIEYETFGDPSNPALLLISGLGGQMLFWPSDFCSKVAEIGFFVIRFDNRDTGLSTKFDSLELKEIQERISDVFMGKKTSAPYSLIDMADDTKCLLDELDIAKAHICGMSMGGFISQTFCIKYPHRVLSLTSIYSDIGNRPGFMPSQDIMDVMFAPVPTERDAFIKYQTDYFKLLSGKGKPFDETFHKDLFGTSYDRCLSIDGTARQYLAIITQKDRTSDLAQLNTPTLVIHGDDDPLIPLAGGEATAKAIPNSELIIIKGMGHDLPNLNSFGSNILDAMVSHMQNI